jgi:DNA-binding transcriptional LysR family regulator
MRVMKPPLTVDAANYAPDRPPTDISVPIRYRCLQSNGQTPLMVGILDDNRLRYLFEATRLASVRKAADALGVNPSVVSRQIAQLEKDLGVPLLERLNRGVRATEAGALLAQRYRQWMADSDDTIAKLREIQGLRRGHLDIILGEGFVADLMAGPLARFWRRHDRLSVSLDLAGTNDVVTAVAEDRYHIGLVFNARPDPRIQCWTSAPQPICLITRPDHPLATTVGPVPFRDIAPLPLGLMHPGYGTRQIVTTVATSEGIGLTAKLTTGSIDVLRHFVKAGLGVALLPAFAVTADLAAGSLTATLIDNPMLLSTQAQIITRLGRELPEAARRLLRDLVGMFEGSKNLLFLKKKKQKDFYP